MPFAVNFDDAFAAEFRALPEAVQDAIRAYALALTDRGYRLGRPWADTLKGSKFAKMKELRPTVNKVEWRVASLSTRTARPFYSRPGRRAAKRTPSCTGG
jgi:hypothetical protein